MRTTFPFLALLASCCLSFTPVAAQASLRARTDHGVIVGIARHGAVAFLGVPYAAPPVGAARWRAPGPLAPWKGDRKTRSFTPSCPQVINPPEGRAPWTPEYLIPGPTSEDCLYLNVWRPRKTHNGLLPILVWIHGGGFREGSGSVPVYDGAALAGQDVVVVTINYRLGVLGFLAHPALSAEQGGASGNYGLLDILAALRWVRANAAAVGGDAARITIAGQSAGATAVQELIASPTAKGLFARAIAESGAGWSADLPGRPEAEAQGEALAQRVSAGSLPELRRIPADELVKAAAAYSASTGVNFSAIVDGRILPVDPKRALLGGAFNDTPILAGVNADEGSGLRPPGDYGRPDLQAFLHRRESLFGSLAGKAAGIYVASSDAEAADADKRLTRDRSLAWTYEWARRRSGVGRQPIYLYLFSHTEPGPAASRYGAFHTSEVPYVFRTLEAAPRPYADDDRRISERMSGRWLSFVRGLSPDLPGRPVWPAFHPQDPSIMVLGEDEQLAPLLSSDKRSLFDALAEGGGTLALY
jgi:para-nitrobenzyl esterase